MQIIRHVQVDVSTRVVLAITIQSKLVQTIAASVVENVYMHVRLPTINMRMTSRID